MKVYLHSIGCRLNQSEIESMGRQLLAAGHELVADSAAADTVVVNTCAVTAEAARDARNLTRRLHKQNEATQIWLTGCYATIAGPELEKVEGVHGVVPNTEKHLLVPKLDPQARIDLPLFDQEPIMREFRAGAASHTRAFVKVQDGCDNKCTFCVTTIARGAGQSRHLGDVVAEIQALQKAGYQEAVLTGVHLGSYGHDFGNERGLFDLVTAVLAHTDIPRLRLSSLEPWDITPDFFRLWQNPRLMPHLHLPLQSGSDAILRRMARRTSQASFRELVTAVRAQVPDINLSTDLIVGFPGETESHFQETMAYVQETAFARLHVFTYSQRPGTAAAKMSGQLPNAIKKERTQRLIHLGQELSHAYHQNFVGHTRPVLWEGAVGADPEGLRWVGYSDNYIRVTAHGPVHLRQTITPTQLSLPTAEGLWGLII